MGFGESIKTCFNKYATFSGRASRSEFWWFQLAFFLSFFTIIGGLILLLPNMSVTVRRLHDVGKSGWWYGTCIILGLFCFIPLIGIFVGIINLILSIVIFVFELTDSDPNSNKYGPNPKIQEGSSRPVRQQATQGTRPTQNRTSNNFYGNGYVGGATVGRDARPNRGEETVFDSGQQMKACLMLNGRRYFLSNGRNIVGRRGETSQATVQIDVDDMYMSRQHCCITVIPQANGGLRAKISNYNNKNKTAINGRVLEQNQEAWLPNTCDITMGHTTMKFSM